MVAGSCTLYDGDLCCKPAKSSNDSETKRFTSYRAARNMIEKLDFHDSDMMVYDLPLTPPSSPCSLEIDMETTDFGTSLDDIPLPTYKKTDSIVIKDCMWGPEELCHSKIREHSYTRLYLGELPSTRTIFETVDLSSKFLNSVDPSEVFPHIDDRTQLKDLTSSDSDEESDADIDVVTVEPKIGKKLYDIFPTSPEILTPPKTPDSEPADNLKVFIQTAPIECVETTRTKSQSSCDDSSNACENAGRRSKEVATLQERFSRASHNVLERKRRNELKGKFYHLRDSIPELAGNKKVPKVVILKKAISFIESIKDEQTTLQSEIQRQKKTQQELRKRLSLILRQRTAR